MLSKQNKGKTTRSNSQNGDEQQGQAGKQVGSLPYADNLLTEVMKIGGTLQIVAADVTSIKSNLTELTSTVTAMQERVTEAETRISSLEDTADRLQTAEGKRNKLFESMWDRIQTLENHGKRNNVRVVGLKETVGADGTLLSCIQKMLAQGLGVCAADPEFEIERAHRALASLPDPDKPPRPVLVRFLRQSARDKVISAAKVKRGFEWEGCRLSVFPDMTRELAEKRKAFTQVKQRLQQQNVRYTLAFPATLRVKWKGRNMSFTSAAAAEKFLNNNEETTASE